jgi:hypothetical protein
MLNKSSISDTLIVEGECNEVSAPALAEECCPTEISIWRWTLEDYGKLKITLFELELMMKRYSFEYHVVY